jgi:hypothetical protein
MTKQDLAIDLDTVAAKLKAGTFDGNIVKFVERAAKALREQHAVVEAAEITSVREGWEAYRRFDERIQQVAKADVPRKAEYLEDAKVRAGKAKAEVTKLEKALQEQTQ